MFAYYIHSCLNLFCVVVKMYVNHKRNQIKHSVREQLRNCSSSQFFGHFKFYLVTLSLAQKRASNDRIGVFHTLACMGNILWACPSVCPSVELFYCSNSLRDRDAVRREVDVETGRCDKITYVTLIQEKCTNRQ